MFERYPNFCLDQIIAFSDRYLICSAYTKSNKLFKKVKHDRHVIELSLSLFFVP